MNVDAQTVLKNINCCTQGHSGIITGTTTLIQRDNSVYQQFNVFVAFALVLLFFYRHALVKVRNDANWQVKDNKYNMDSLC